MVLGLAALAAVGLWWGLARGGTKTAAPAATTTAVRTTVVVAKVKTVPVLSEHVTGSLGAPLQDPAYAAVGAGGLLLGGLTAADTSSSSILYVNARGDRPRGTLPTARHDTAAVTIGGAVYLFGGGDGTKQLDEILRIDPATGRVTAAGRLPAASSDSGAAAVGGTAYVVGGYTGTRWLDTIVAWKPGGAAHVVAHLPSPVRYAAVTAVGGTVVIAGGSLPPGRRAPRCSASTPPRAPSGGSGRCRRRRPMPRPRRSAGSPT